LVLALLVAATIGHYASTHTAGASVVGGGGSSW
jgi:hypothetical protein